MRFSPTEEHQIAIDSPRRFLDEQIETRIDADLGEERWIPGIPKIAMNGQSAPQIFLDDVH